MQTTARSAFTTSQPDRPWARDLAGFFLILAVGLAGYWLFPDNLAFLTGVVAMALLALSLDLLVGYCGIASLGQAALYGAGAYAAGIACVNGIAEPVSLILVGAAAGAVCGLVMGVIMLRTHGLPQLVLSIALVQLLHEAVNKASTYTGGSDGLSGLTLSSLFGTFAFDLWGQTAYLFGLALLAVVFIVLRGVVQSPFGMLCRGIREDPVRIRAMGAFVFPTLLKMFVLSGAVAGIGGALGAISTQVVGLDSVSFELSANALVMLVLGGVGTLYGALVGTVIFMGFEHVVASRDPFNWLTLVGLLLIGVVLFAPRGLQGLLTAATGYRPKRRGGAP